jgi:hypothetical protein
MFVICASLFGGCVKPVTLISGTATTLPIDNPVIRPLPLTADLNVSEKRATGKADGPALEMERLTNAAVANALGQDPPSVNAADVLVGMKLFTEQTGDYMTVTVTGYPAYYTNFHTAEEMESAWLNIIMPAGHGGGHITPPGRHGTPEFGLPKQEGGAPRLRTPETTINRTVFYFTPKYMLPIGIPCPLAFHVEFGWIWTNGFLFGIDLNGGGGGNGAIIGGGFNLGGVHNLSAPKTQIAYGGAVGFWVVHKEEYHEKSYSEPRYYYDGYGNEYVDYYYHGSETQWTYRTNWNFLAPFIKFRWQYIELSYRGLLGFYEDNDGGGFSWNNNQIMLGLYFGGR